MSISSISSLLNQSSVLAASSVVSSTSNPTQFQQQLSSVNSTDPTSTANSSSSTSTASATPVKGKGGHHHHHRSSASDAVDSQNVLDNLTETYGSDAADEVVGTDGTVDLTKLSQFLASQDGSAASAKSTNSLLSIMA